MTGSRGKMTLSSSLFVLLLVQCLCGVSSTASSNFENASNKNATNKIANVGKNLTDTGNPPLFISEEISKLEFVDVSSPSESVTESMSWMNNRQNLKYNSTIMKTEPMNSVSASITEALKEDFESIISPSDLEWLLNIYNPHRWGTSPPGMVTKECHYNTRLYLKALKSGVTWAAKMTDASGHYSSQFFFGNDFWLGSRFSCEEIGNNATNAIVPPFQIRFHIAKLHITLAKELTPNSRRIFLGICLPTACSSKDIYSILHQESKAINNTNYERNLEVVTVRPVPGEYSLFSDVKFHILGGVTAVACLFMILGTSFETMLMYRTPDTSGKANDSENVVDGDNNNEIVDCKKSIETKTKTTTRKPGVLGQFLLAFSVITNGKKILNCSTPEDSLTSVHGLRFLSLAWVIMVHTYLQVFAIAENKFYRTVTERNFMYQTIGNATFSVDTFFFISGLLVTFLYFKTVLKSDVDAAKKSDHGIKRSFIKFLTLVFYRFVRLTPVYLFVLGLVEISMRWIRNNSVFEPLIFDELNCDNYWWRNALYINSLFPRKDMCMLWSWYMANDTQFYIIGIMLLLLAVNYFRYVVAALGVFLVSSWATTAYIALHYEYQARVQEPFALFDELYDKPWTRLGPYLMGMITGYILFKTKCKLRIPTVLVVVGWTFALSCLISLVYGLLLVQLDVPTSAAYVALGHTAWGLALGWIVIACCTGYGGLVNSLLSYHALYPLSRLTYCAYLVHPMIMVLTSFQMDGPIHLHNIIVIILYLGNVVASFLLSFLISLAFEAPIVRLLKITMTSNKKTS